MTHAQHRAAHRLGAAAFAVLVAACARNEVPDAAEPRRSTARMSLVFTRVGPAGAPRFEGQGHFVRFAASDADHVPAILGLPDDDAIPLDTCRAIDSGEALDRALSAARSTLPVRLLDAGRIQIKGPHDATELAPRHYPELTPYVAGVVYGNEDTLPLGLDPGALYEVAAEGGDDIGPFVSQVVAPRAFPTLEVPQFRRGELEVRWSEAGEASDPLVLTVIWTARGGAREVRCRVRDDGSYTVARELLAEMPPPTQLLSAEVAAVRTRTAPVTAPGIGRGELRVGLRDELPLPLSAWPAASAPPPNGLGVPGAEER